MNEGEIKICTDEDMEFGEMKFRPIVPHIQKATLGRMVHYMRYGSPGGEHKPEMSPAVITKILNEETQECQLFVMNPNGTYFNPTPFSNEPKPGHWSWPPLF